MEQKKNLTRGTHEFEGRDILIQGYKINEDFGEIQLSNILFPKIIHDDKSIFEPLHLIQKADTNITEKFETKTYIYVNLIIFSIFVITTIFIFFIWKLSNVKNNRKKKNEKKTADVFQSDTGGVKKNEDVFQSCAGGVI